MINHIKKNKFLRYLAGYIYNDIFPLPINFICYFIPKRKNLWLFGAWHGESFSDNPKYLFLYIIKYHPDIDAVWITSNLKVYNNLRKKGLKVSLNNTIQTYKLAARANIACCTHLSVSRDISKIGFSKKTNVIYLAHGFPIKRIDDEKILGYNHQFINFIKSVNKLLDAFFLRAKIDYVTLLSDEDKKLLKGVIEQAKGIKSGQARNDVFFQNINNNTNKENFKKILYLPTFRGDIRDKFENLFFSQKVGFNEKMINKRLKENNAILYIKLHPVDMKKCTKFLQSSNIIFLEEEDVHNFLKDVDILITDYSGIFVDYLLTLRPIIFANFDFEKYKDNDRGFYYDYDRITPGPKVQHWDDILEWIEKYIDDANIDREERLKIRNKFHLYKDSKNSERIYNFIKQI